MTKEQRAWLEEWTHGNTTDLDGFPITRDAIRAALAEVDALRAEVADETLVDELESEREYRRKVWDILDAALPANEELLVLARLIVAERDALRAEVEYLKADRVLVAALVAAAEEWRAASRAMISKNSHLPRLRFGAAVASLVEMIDARAALAKLGKP